MKRRIKTIGILLSAIIIAVATAFMIWHTRYYAELNDIKKRLSDIPGIQILSIQGTPDITLEHIFASILVNNKGRMVFLSISPSHFEKSGCVYLNRIGNLEVDEMCIKDRCTSWGNAIDIGSEGPLGKLFPIRIDNIQSAIEHYDDIYSILNRWPRHPKRMTFQNNSNTTYYLSIKEQRTND